MHFLNIGSGSKGNSTIIYNEETTILVDVGVSKRRIVTALKTINKKNGQCLPLTISIIITYFLYNYKKQFLIILILFTINLY